MAHCRVGYLAALLAAGLFYICFEEYFSFYILVLALVFPFFSLAVSLPGMLGCGATLVLSGRRLRRGGELEAKVHVTNRFHLPLGRLAIELRYQNLLTGEQGRVRRRLTGASAGAELEEALPVGHCGVLRWEITRMKVCDLLGLFSLKRPLPPVEELTILPAELPPEHVPVLLDEARCGRNLKPRPGGGPGEDYDLRPYRPGDPMRSVHWKLSSKTDALVVRETLEPVKTVVVLTYDHFGAPEALDAVFDRLDAVSRALTGRERPHYIQWADPVAGTVRRRLISSLADLRAWEWEAFSTPAPSTGRSILDAPLYTNGMEGVIQPLHISADGWKEAESLG